MEKVMVMMRKLKIFHTIVPSRQLSSMTPSAPHLKFTAPYKLQQAVEQHGVMQYAVSAQRILGNNPRPRVTILLIQQLGRAAALRIERQQRAPSFTSRAFDRA